jgi:hypothetical protein
MASGQKMVVFVGGFDQRERAGQSQVVIVDESAALVMRAHIIEVDDEHPGIRAGVPT